MANDFVLVRCNLVRSAEVVVMATRLGIPPAHVVGCLAVVWGWARDEMDEAGTVGVPPEYLDALTGVEGFADAMRGRGWLDTTADSVRFPDPGRWINRDAIKRARDADRKRRAREVSAMCPQDVRDMSAKERTKTRLDREEDREGEEEKSGGALALHHDTTTDTPLWVAVSRRLSRMAGVGPEHLPRSLVSEVIGYTAGQDARKRNAVQWPEDAGPMDRTRMLEAAFEVAEAKFKGGSAHGATAFVLSILEDAIPRGEYPTVREQPERDTRPAWQREREEQRQAKLAAVREARSRRETA